jgi:hypothetical protein
MTLNKKDWVEKEVAEYPLELPVHNKSVLRSMKEKEFDEEEFSNADLIYGFDDGEPVRKY